LACQSFVISSVEPLGSIAVEFVGSGVFVIWMKQVS
jgi:nitrate reductase NapE component